MTAELDPSPWQDPLHVPGRSSAQSAARRADMLAPSTQIVSDREAYLGQGRHDVGRRISDDQVELFISTDVAHALQQEFILHQPEFLAFHDVGTSASLRLLTSLAGVAGARVQRLTVRRQGQGVALAVLQFVEMRLGDGTLLRLYSTDLNADGQTRNQLAQVLLAHSSLGVLLVGELPPHALTGQLAPLHESLLRGPWPNRELLMVPLGTGTALAAQAAQLASNSPVSVHVTPHASKPRQVWGFIGGAWNRLHHTPGAERLLEVDMSAAVPKPQVPDSLAPTQPMPLEGLAPAPGPTQAPRPPTPMPVPGSTRWQSYADRCLLIKGGVACCVFDAHSRQTLAFAGGPPTGDRLAQHGAVLLAAMHDAARGLGLGAVRTEASISTTSNHLLVRPVPGHPGIAILLVMQAGASNLTLARMQLERIEAPA